MDVSPVGEDGVRGGDESIHYQHREQSLQLSPSVFSLGQDKSTLAENKNKEAFVPGSCNGKHDPFLTEVVAAFLVPDVVQRTFLVT